LINPLNFISPQFVAALFNIEETKIIEKLFQCYENWRGVYSIRLRAV